MVPRLVMLCVGIVVLQGIACAQDVNAPATVGQLNQLRDDIKADMRAEIKAAIAEATGQDAQQNDGLVPVKPVGTLEERVTAIEAAQRRMQRVQGNHGVALGQIAMKGESGDYHVRFDTNSQSARNEVKRALDSTVPERADFVIYNRTNHDEWIIVNGEQHLVLAQASLPLKVQPGTVTSRLRYQQQPLAMYVGFPKYYQSVDIKDRPLAPIGWVAANW